MERKEFNNIHLLLAEDNQMISVLMKRSLINEGLKVDTAENGKEVLDTFDVNRHDLILMDLQMPIMNGIEATIELREKRAVMVPIIALTATSCEQEIEKCKQAGINDVVKKPCEAQKLLEVISLHLP